MKFGVIVFPGSNCDHDAFYAASQVLGQKAEFIWHDSHSLGDVDVVILPGGFSYGDYLRCGAIAKFSPVMRAVRQFAADGGLVMGICNGFQILVEAGLLPGALIRNRGLKFVCREVSLRVETVHSPFTSAAHQGQVLRMPMAHGEGCYIADRNTLDELEAEDRVLFRYLDNPNGSTQRHRRHSQSRAQCDGDDAAPRARQREPHGVRRRPHDLPVGTAIGGEGMTIHPPELIAQHQLTAVRIPQDRRHSGPRARHTELGIFSVMWSEHCSYKSSRLHLKKLPTRGRLVVQGPGENAGIIDIGGGYVIAFKIESHNHPSFIEPFQGAATGVGGILRDIFTMGARPIAVLDSLRFGRLDDAVTGARNRRILGGVVGGIAHYGNCFGVPTVGGETIFEPCYDGNPLVNVFALGICRKEDVFYASAAGVGNPVIYVGARTGRDGIHGASMASAEFTEESKQKRPNVQVGDPFMEKLLLEACLEAMHTGAIVGIQDMGAAGLTCSTCEMGSRGEVGIEIELDRVPQRETGMTPYEIMLSESQERMLLVADKGSEEEVFRVFRKWGLEAVEIGIVTGDGKLRVRHHGEVVAEIPNRELADEAPLYDRPYTLPPRAGLIPDYPSTKLQRTLPQMLAAPDICSKRWIWEQYDHQVRTNTVALPGTHRRRHPAHQGDGNVDRDVARRQRPLLLSFAARGRETGGGRVLPQSLDRRRTARGRHQLPELRQSRAAGDHGATGAGN